MTNPSDPAFANELYNKELIPKDAYSLGLTKREYFAAKAMQALIERMPGRLEVEPVCTAAFGFADGLIASANKENSKP